VSARRQVANRGSWKSRRSGTKRGRSVGTSSPTRRTLRRGDDRGQAVVELALVLPLIVVFVGAGLQVAVVARDQLAIEYVAREAARAAAVSADPGQAARAAADRVTGLSPIDVAVNVAGEVVRVRVRYVNVTDLALVGAAIGDVTLEATAAMAWEPP